MIKLRWSIIDGNWQTSYKGFIICSAKPQKWTRIYKNKIQYFKLLNPALKSPILTYSQNVYDLIVTIEKYKGKRPLIGLSDE